jgi:hypothetical protein
VSLCVYTDNSFQLDFVQRRTSIEQVDLDAAKRSLICNLIQREQTLAQASEQSILAIYRRVDADFNKRVCDRVWTVCAAALPFNMCLHSQVTAAEIQHALETYMSPLFDVHATATAIACHPSKVDATIDEFEKRYVRIVLFLFRKYLHDVFFISFEMKLHQYSLEDDELSIAYE